LIYFFLFIAIDFCYNIKSIYTDLHFGALTLLVGQGHLPYKMQLQQFPKVHFAYL